MIELECAIIDHRQPLVFLFQGWCFYSAKRVRPLHGRVRLRRTDGDGRPDLMVLQAQARESLLLFLNEGDGKFRRQLIYQRPPSWGHSGFELADFNRDGAADANQWSLGVRYKF